MKSGGFLFLTGCGGGVPLITKKTFERALRKLALSERSDEIKKSDNPQQCSSDGPWYAAWKTFVKKYPYFSPSTYSSAVFRAFMNKT